MYALLFIGLKPLQQRRFLRVLKEHCDADEALTMLSHSVPAMYDRYGHGVIVDSISSPFVTMSVRYILCRDLFTKEAREHVVVQLFLNRTTMEDLIDRIRSKEGFQQEYVLELFTHEGYPININNYNGDCKFLL